jgi:circadian clock protein KaiC
MLLGANKLFETRIPNLDVLLGGGIPRRQTLIVTGSPGGGKTILVNQIAFLAAAQGVPVVFSTLTSEPHDKLIEQLSAFKFFPRELLGEQVFLINTCAAMKKSGKEARDLLLGAVRERAASLLVIDGLRSMRDLWQDEARLREFFYELGTGLAAVDCVGLLTTEYPIERLLAARGHHHRRHPLADDQAPRRPAASPGRGRQGARPTSLDRRALPRDQRGGDPDHSPNRGTRATSRGFRAERGARLVRCPRAGRAAGRWAAGRDHDHARGQHGNRQDPLLPPIRVGRGAQGEKTLFVGFVEEPGVLAARAYRIGLDVRRSIASGALQLLYQPPTEMEADSLVDRVLAEIARLGARRLVIDGLGELELSVADVDRRELFFGALSMRLRLAGVTSLFTKEVAKIAGSELDFSSTPIAILGENLLLLRFVELRGRIHRILSVLRMRDSKYQSDLREFEISDQGIRVLAPLRSAQGLLTGQALPLGSAIGGEEPS